MAALKALADIRSRISELQGQISEIETASLPAADVQGRVKAFIQNFQSRFDDGYIGRGLVSAEAGISTTDIFNAATGEDLSEKVMAIAAWLDPAGLERKLMESAAPHIASKGLPSEKRPALLRKLDDELDRLLADEEQLIVELEAAGLGVFRRGNVDPLVVLGI